MPYFTDFLYLVASPFMLPPYLYRIFLKKKYRESTKGMLGFCLPENKWERVPGKINLWLHAVSVGEVVAGKAVLAEWKKRDPETRILASTVTETGQKKARNILSEASDFTYYPVDFSPVVNRFLDTYSPDVYIMMETEIWPNFLREAASRGVKIFLANGKLSERSFRRWMQFRSLFRSTFDSISAACVQTEKDREKFVSLLRRPDDVFVTGNCKFDSSGEPIPPARKAEFLEQMKISPESRILVVGSTHPGEEEIVIDAWRKARRDFPELKMILAPRHPERFDEVRRLLEKSDIRFNLYTRPERENPDAVLIDTIGILAELYGIGEIAVLCGSFAPIGGHNLLEAAVHGIPVVFGPHMHNQPEILRLFREGGGGLQIRQGELASTIKRLLSDDIERARIGSAAAETSRKNRGSARRTVEFIRSRMKK